MLCHWSSAILVSPPHASPLIKPLDFRLQGILVQRLVLTGQEAVQLHQSMDTVQFCSIPRQPLWESQGLGFELPGFELPGLSEAIGLQAHMPTNLI